MPTRLSARPSLSLVTSSFASVALDAGGAVPHVPEQIDEVAVDVAAAADRPAACRRRAPRQRRISALIAASIACERRAPEAGVGAGIGIRDRPPAPPADRRAAPRFASRSRTTSAQPESHVTRERARQQRAQRRLQLRVA